MCFAAIDVAFSNASSFFDFIFHCCSIFAHQKYQLHSINAKYVIKRLLEGKVFSVVCGIQKKNKKVDEKKIKDTNSKLLLSSLLKDARRLLI